MLWVNFSFQEDSSGLSDKLLHWISFEKTQKNTEALRKFENPDYLLGLQEVSSSESKKLTIQSLHYVDKRGSPIKFFKKSVANPKTGIESFQLVLEENPQYFISKDQTVGKLEGLPHFLVVENIAGENKVIIPHKRVSDLAFTQSEYHYEMIDLDSSGQPAGKSTLQNLLLAYFALAGKNYAEAKNYLRMAHRQLAYESAELKLLGWVAMLHDENSDYHPEALAVRSYACWLVDENGRRLPKKLQKKMEERDPALLQPYDEASMWAEFWEGKRKLALKTNRKITAQELMATTYENYLRVSTSVSQELRIETANIRDIFPIENSSWQKIVASISQGRSSAADLLNFLKQLNADPLLNPEEKKLVAINIYSKFSVQEDFIEIITDKENDADFANIYAPELFSDKNRMKVHMQYLGVSEHDIKNNMSNCPNKNLFLNALAYYYDKTQISCYPGLLTPFEEAAWIASMVANNPITQLTYRLNHLLAQPIPQQVEAELPEVKFPEKSYFSHIFSKNYYSRPIPNSEEGIQAYLNSLAPISRRNLDREFSNLFEISKRAIPVSSP